MAGNATFMRRMLFLIKPLRTANHLAAMLKACLFAIAHQLASQNLILLAARNFKGDVFASTFLFYHESAVASGIVTFFEAGMPARQNFRARRFTRGNAFEAALSFPAENLLDLISSAEASLVNFYFGRTHVAFAGLVTDFAAEVISAA